MPAGLIADAVTILSPAWVDERSTNDLSGSARSAYSPGTTINAAIITGNVPSQGWDYSGGMENLTRLLENWSTSPQRNLYVNGSLVLLFESQKAVGRWDTGEIYRPPYRTFRFGPHIGATAPIVRDLSVGLLSRAAWRTTSPGSIQ
jgi:hypothetical protein